MLVLLSFILCFVILSYILGFVNLSKIFKFTTWEPDLNAGKYQVFAPELVDGNPKKKNNVS